MGARPPGPLDTSNPHKPIDSGTSARHAHEPPGPLGLAPTSSANSDDLTWFEFEPSDPARPDDIRFRIVDPTSHQKWVDTRLTAVGFSVYLLGYHLYCEGIDLPVYVPETYVDLTVTQAISVSNTIYDDHTRALAAVKAAEAKGADPRVRFAYYWGAGGALVVPTLFSPATTPNTCATMMMVRKELGEQVQRNLAVMAVSLIGGAVLRQVLRRLYRAPVTPSKKRQTDAASPEPRKSTPQQEPRPAPQQKPQQPPQQEPQPLPQPKRRSEHAEQRRAEGRPTGPAFNDAQRARQGDVYVQEDGRYVVRGARGREHIFEKNGEHLTSIERSNKAHQAKVVAGERSPISNDGFEAFKNLFR